jgi:hypothetical protein
MNHYRGGGRVQGFVILSWLPMRVPLLDAGQDTGNLVHQRHPHAQRIQRNVFAYVREHSSPSLAC